MKEVAFWEQNLTKAYNPAPIPEESFFSQYLQMWSLLLVDSLLPGALLCLSCY